MNENHSILERIDRLDRLVQIIATINAADILVHA